MRTQLAGVRIDNLEFFFNAEGELIEHTRDVFTLYSVRGVKDLRQVIRPTGRAFPQFFQRVSISFPSRCRQFYALRRVLPVQTAWQRPGFVICLLVQK